MDESDSNNKKSNNDTTTYSLPGESRENRETAILYRVDERTLQIMNRLERLQEWSERQDSRLSRIENTVSFHQTVIKGILFVLAALTTAVVGSLVGVIVI